MSTFSYPFPRNRNPTFSLISLADRASGTMDSMDEKNHVSVFVVINYLDGPDSGAVLKIDVPKSSGKSYEELEFEESYSEAQIDSPVFTTFRRDEVSPHVEHCFFHAARLSSSSNLYLTAHLDYHSSRPYPDLFAFDTHKLSLLPKKKKMSPPKKKKKKNKKKRLCLIDVIPQAKANKSSGVLVSAYGKLYYCAAFHSAPSSLEKSSFVCYDPCSSSWQILPSCPSSPDFTGMKICGFAVCYGYILFSLFNLPVNFDGDNTHIAVAFHIKTAKWHRVELPSGKQAIMNFPFRGRAVVLDGLLYASHFWHENIIVVFTFLHDSDGNCYLGALTCLGVDTPAPLTTLAVYRSQSLIQLERQHLCLIQIGDDHYPGGGSFLSATTFKIDDQKGATTAVTLRMDFFKVPWIPPFDLNFCFTSDYKENEPEDNDYLAELAQCSISEPSCPTGACKFVAQCGFHHSIDMPAAPFHPEVVKVAGVRNVKLTLAGLPRTKGTDICSQYLETGTCDVGAFCRYDHPIPGELLAMAKSGARI